MSKPTERLERTDPTKPVELVTYDASGREIGRKSPTGYDVCRVRQRERRQGVIVDGVTWERSQS